MGVSLLCLLGGPAAVIHNPWVSTPLIFLVAAGTMGGFSIFFTLAQDISPRHSALCSGVVGGSAWFLIAVLHPQVGKLADRIGTFVPIIIGVGFIPLLGALAMLAWPEPEKQVTGDR
jgi:hypothetical protein